LSPGSNDAATEADGLCSLISRNFDALRASRMGGRFQLGAASFRLHSSARNTIYRVAHQFNWFLKLARSGDIAPFVHEQIGSEIISGTLGTNADYAGARVIRISTAPPFVLSSTIEGRPLNTVFFTNVWTPTLRAQTTLEEHFETLGLLLAELHAAPPGGADMPDATTAPFRMLQRLLDQRQDRDRTTNAIASWLRAHARSDGGKTFIHGNLRFDNVLNVGSRLAFIDFENCGTGSAYQDVSRPVTELLLTRCVIGFPVRRATRCIDAFLRAYARRHSLDEQALNDFVTARIARYYMEAGNKNIVTRRIGGIPVSMRSIETVTLNALTHGDKPLW
jgi:aminoglycoside phosphotransferase (APT) family kinase protein